MKKKLSMWVISLLLVTLTACGGNEIPTSKETQVETQIVETVQESVQETSSSNPVKTETVALEMKADETAGIFDGYNLIEVDGGNQSGYREPNVVVDIGFGDREYWAYTNEYGQLVKVTAKEIILQDDATEPVNSDGRYYDDEAKVPGVESKDLDEGHVIADSLGGVSNAYNITPQNSTLNRHGDQAYMEKVIRDAGGCTDFTAIITYPDTSTQIPSHYSYTYTLNGNVINDEFDNINPDDTYDTSSAGTSDNTTSVVAPAATASDGSTVYWTPNGKSYHTTPECSTLSRSKTILSGTLSESGKSDPCDRCH